jgi:hypothetical protein
MDAAGKAAQAEARAKKLPAKKEQPKAEPEKPAVAPKSVEVAKPEPPTTFSLFDAPATETPVAEDVDEEEEILRQPTENPTNPSTREGIAAMRCRLLKETGNDDSLQRTERQSSAPRHHLRRWYIRPRGAYRIHRWHNFFCMSKGQRLD